jgi:hypothetical protein
MLLGLLSVVTGATSVKGMGEQFAAVKIGGAESRFMAMPNPNAGSREVAFANATSAGATKFISLDASNKSGSHEYINMDTATVETMTVLLNKFNDTDVICVYPKFATTVATFNQVSADEQAKIATIYACWMIKNGGLYPAEGKVNLNGQEVQLTEKQNTLVKSYFIKANESFLNPSEPKKPETKVQAKSSSKASKIALATAGGLAAAYLSYLAIGNIVYNHAGCTDESSSLTCAATSHANYMAENDILYVHTCKFLTAAAAVTGYSVTVLWNSLKQILPALPVKQTAQQLAQQFVYQPNCSQFDRPAVLPTCSSSEQPIIPVANAGFIKGLLWPFLR